jgi:hypothetical protein
VKIKLGFPWADDDSEPVQLCVVCDETLTNYGIKLSRACEDLC